MTVELMALFCAQKGCDVMKKILQVNHRKRIDFKLFKWHISISIGEIAKELDFKGGVADG
jgi:hypothetical protein